MRIQHNIMAMNAYRNYNHNTSALSKNLERLSSGYKINRAGDDAAGLAISEKMRAQITGLEAAQKNVKDGISLVNTAEGAMQEIQDMLNRMVYLAQQSANGTYDDAVDRKNLQDEVNQLRSEINRIADSANFNGTKLLDGSLDVNGDLTTKIDFSTDQTSTVGKLLPTGVNNILGTNTVKHNSPAGDGGTEFSVDLHNVTFSNQVGDKLVIEVGEGEDGFTIELEATAITGSTAARKELTGEQIAAAIKKGTDATNGLKVTIKGGDAAEAVSGAFKVSGQEVKMTGVSGERLTFKQTTAPTADGEEVNGSMKVTVTGKVAKQVDATPAATPKGQELVVDTAKLGALTNNTEVDLGNSMKFSYDSTKTLKEQIEAAVGSGYTVTVTADAATGKTTIALDYADAANPPADNKKVTQFNTTEVTNTYLAVTTNTPANDTVTASKTANDSGAKVIDLTDAAVSKNFKVEIGGKTYTGSTTASAMPTAPATEDIALTLEGGTTASEYVLKIDDTGKFWVENTNGVDDANADVKVFTGTNYKDVTNLGALTGGTPVSGDTNVFDATALSKWVSGKLTIGVDGSGDPVEIEYDGNSVASSIAAAADKITDFDISYDAGASTLTVTVAAGSTAPLPTSLNVSFKNENLAVTATNTTTPGTPATKTEYDNVSPVDYNVSTTDISQVTAAGAHRLASTAFNLDASMIEDGAKIKIGDDEYTFTTKEGQDKGVYIGDVADLKNVTADELKTIAKRLTDAAAENKLYTVGHDGTRITLTETTAHDKLYTEDDGSASDGWDLRTVEGIEKSLGFTGAAKSTNKGLSLQIGDTSDSYNQLTVSIGDMHTTAMKDKNGVSIDDIDISNQKGAQDAVDVIKNAINYVSSVRGTLGAISNRLDHTANNLSVMRENIQDAESTIRDTDIAEEMMAYTKNNILVQSAQAMLAQANQVPQGVLQLLQ